MSSTAILAISCGLAAAIAWGFGDFWAAKAARSVGPVGSAIAVNLIGVAGFLAYFLATHDGGDWAGAGIGYSAAAGIAFGVGQITLFQALSIGPVSLASPLASAYPLITTLLMVTFLGTHLSWQQGTGVGAVVLGAMAASELFDRRQTGRWISRATAFALTTALTWGIAYACVVQALRTLDWPSVSLVQLVIVSAVCPMLGSLIAGNEVLLSRASLRIFRNPFILATGLIQMLGIVIINVGIARDTGLAPTVTAISSAYSVITVLLALKSLDEEYKLIPLAGAGLVVAGIVVLSLT